MNILKFVQYDFKELLIIITRFDSPYVTAYMSRTSLQQSPLYNKTILNPKL